VKKKSELLRLAIVGVVAVSGGIVAIFAALIFMLLTVFTQVEAQQPANCRFAPGDNEMVGAAWLNVEQSVYSTSAAPMNLWDIWGPEVLASVGTLTDSWGRSRPVSGRIDQSLLQPLSWAPGHKLHPAAAGALEMLNEAWYAEHGSHLPVTSSFRDYAGQVNCLATKGGLCAKPAGTSNHGWGMAVDLGGGINIAGTAAHQWMRANGANFGWFHPDWAEQNGSKPEPWHWEFVPLGDVVCEDAGSPGGNRELGKELAAEQGWTNKFSCVDESLADQSPAVIKTESFPTMTCTQIGWDWDNLDQLVTADSGWDHAKHNTENLCFGNGREGISYGIPQRCDALYPWDTDEEMYAWLGSPEKQIQWMIDRIAAIYGSPTEALAQFQSQGWY